MVKLRIGSDVIENINLTIFDKDGTLIDLYNYWFNMVSYRANLAKERFGLNEGQKKDLMFEMGVDVDRRRLRREGPVGIKKREVVMQAMIDFLVKLGFSDTHDICYEIFRIADKESLSHLSEIIRPINGMRELIDKLFARECYIVIATTDKTERAKLAMQVLGISDKLKLIIGEDAVKNYKPYPDMLNLILRELRIEKASAVMIGDAVADVEMGINAGVKASIGVCSGISSKEELLKKTAYVADDVSCIEVV